MEISLQPVCGAVETRLLPWFSAHARDLPWRRRRTLYRVWVAEVMLQQTRVDTVIAYYQRWMRRFPSWKSLADASMDDVLKCWEGLGYYTRARHLHAAAKRMAALPAGQRPSARLLAREGLGPLLSFPGIGPYTAAAIASLAFGVDAAVVDGNVIRVLSRLFADPGDVRSAAVKRRMQQRADALLVHGRAGECNEAMMELGALVCVPATPKCAVCPLQPVCAAFAQGSPDEFPVARKRAAVPHLIVGAAVTCNRRGEVLIAQRREGELLGGLWEFPGGKQEPGETIRECIARELREELGIEVRVLDFLMTVEHAYSHFTMTMHVYTARILRGRPRPLHCADYAWVHPLRLRDYAYSKADLQVVARLQEQGGIRRA